MPGTTWTSGSPRTAPSTGAPAARDPPRNPESVPDPATFWSAYISYNVELNYGAYDVTRPHRHAHGERATHTRHGAPRAGVPPLHRPGRRADLARLSARHPRRGVRGAGARHHALQLARGPARGIHGAGYHRT